MTLNISPEKMAEYRAGYKERQELARKKLDKRFELAWETARQGADLLRKRFGVNKVAVFGSLVNRSRFHIRSDIDLAVWGIAEEDYLRALGCLLDLTTEFSIDLVRVEETREYLQKVIDAQGILL